MNRTKIPWCDYTWNPIVGCSPVSEGCRHCYAAAMSRRFSLPWGTAHFIERLNPARLKIAGFVCSMADLYHETVDDVTRSAVFNVIGRCPQHTFIILTKRPHRFPKGAPWFENIWLGVTVENQQEAEARIPALIATSAAIRFVSVEPMLGPVDLTRVKFPTGVIENVLDGKANLNPRYADEIGPLNCVDWVIAGPETGPGARACDGAWIDALGEQSPCFFDKRKEWRRREFPKAR